VHGLIYSILILMLTLFLGKVIRTGSDNILLGVTEEIFPDTTTDADACLSESLICTIINTESVWT